MRQRVMPSRCRPGEPPVRAAANVIAFRLVFGLLLATGLVCFAMYIGTGQVAWRQRGIVVVKWTLFAALGFFAVLILERLPQML